MRQRLRVLTKCRQTYAYSTFPLRHSAVLAQGVKLSYFQNGLLKIDFTETNKLVKLKVISTWRDDCEIIESSIEDLDDFVWMNDEASRLTSILFNNNNKDAKANSSSDSSKDINLTLSIPEYCNLEIKGNNMDFIQEKKIQGDVDVDIKKGNIFVNKVRGQLIRMQAWNGNINVKTAIEGNVKLTGKEIAIKMMNVDSLNLHAHKLNVEAIYSKSAEIVTYGDTEINHMQGRCNVRQYLYNCLHDALIFY